MSTYYFILYQIFKKPWDANIGKILVVLDLTSILQNRNRNIEIPSYLVTFAVVWNFATFESYILKVVIDLGLSLNLISQIKIKDIWFWENFNQSKKCIT